MWVQDVEDDRVEERDREVGAEDGFKSHKQEQEYKGRLRFLICKKLEEHLIERFTFQ